MPKYSFKRNLFFAIWGGSMTDSGLPTTPHMHYVGPDWSTGSFRKFETNINNFGIGYFMFSAGFRSFKLNNF